MMKKKLLPWLLCVCMLAASGCAGVSNTQTPAGDNSSASVSTAATSAVSAAGSKTDADAAADTSAPAASSVSADSSEPAAAASSASSAEQTGADANGTVYTGGSPWLDTDLKSNITADMELSAREDFHLYVNHDWLMENEIPEGRRSHNAFFEANDKVIEKAVNMLGGEDLTSPEGQLVQSLYRAALDWNSRNAAEVKPAAETILDILRIDSIEDLNEFICNPEKSEMVDTILQFGNSGSPEDSNTYITVIATDDFTLGDAAEYSNRTSYGDSLYKGKLYLAKAMLGRFGYKEKEAQTMFDQLIDLEAKIAEVSYTSADSMQPDYITKILNHYSPEQLAELSPAFPLPEALANFGFGEAKDYLVVCPAAVSKVNELYTEENLEEIRSYMLIRYLIEMAPLLDEKAYQASVEADNIINGSTGSQPYETVAFNKVRDYLRNPMAKAYVEYYDASEMKQRVTQICEDVVAAYRVMLTEEDWLSEETQAKAIEKLDNLRIQAAYPDKWIDYSSLNLTGLSYLDCMKAITHFEYQMDASHTNGTVDKDLWTFDTLDANAAYHSGRNAIYIYLGILEAPFYEDGMSDEQLMGSIGVVIGHEISHAFDPSGAKYDKDGNLSNWWTEEDSAAFQERAARLIAYYDNITVWEGQNAIGSNVQTEAVADMAGMKVMLSIAREKESFDYDAFFRAFAKVWAGINTTQLEYQALTQDSHPLHFLRTNVTLQQFDEFYETYGVQEGDTMYLAPEDRILVW